MQQSNFTALKLVLQCGKVLFFALNRVRPTRVGKYIFGLSWIIFRLARNRNKTHKDGRKISSIIRILSRQREKDADRNPIPSISLRLSWKWISIKRVFRTSATTTRRIENFAAYRRLTLDCAVLLSSVIKLCISAICTFCINARKISCFV